MIRRLLIALAVLGVASSAAAAPRKVLVLPVDGNADPAVRARLTAQVVRLARSIDGQVATADTTFADTALAVGCEPRAPSCRDEVLATLAVDELVWATATRDGAQTRLTVRRATRSAAPREVVATIAASDPDDRIEGHLAPLFAPAGSTAPALPPPAPPVPEAAPAPGPLAPARPLPERVSDRRDRSVGLVVTVSGGVALGLGLALWASYASLQRSIDDHPVRSRDDFDELTALEDRAASRAIAGDLLVAAGLVTTGIGAYLLFRPVGDRRVAISPTPLAHGAGLTLTIAGGL